LCTDRWGLLGSGIPAGNTGWVSIEFLGGYRLVRKLGEGPRAEVYLGHPTREGSDAPSAAIKVFRPDVPQLSVSAEIEALSRASGPHCVTLLDLATAPDGSPALLLERLPGGSLARLLRHRSRVRVGEAITVLAPIALTVSALHAAGVVHGAVRAESVLFTGEGAPVLACFGTARLIQPAMPPALLATEHGVADDQLALSGLARSVLSLVHDDQAAELLRWFDETPAPGVVWLDEAVTNLFALGDASSIDFEQEPHASAPRSIPRHIAEAAPTEGVARPSWLSAVSPPEWIESGITPLIARLRAALALVRPRVWVIAGAVASALVAAIVVVPSSGSDATAEAPAQSSPAPTLAADAQQGPVTGDDPIAAFLALVEARDRCIRDLSVLCLDDVDQPGSAALDTDQALVRAVQDGTGAAPTWEISASQVAVAERLGNSALLDLDDPAESEPASVLLMKGEAGWRIRDYLG